ncbi:MAG: glutathione S-transferase family protein [Cyanobacteria bacterium P01_A01_bin.17]
MTELQIIGLPQSNYVWATRLFIAEKGVPHTMVPAEPHSPPVSEIHPLGKVPVMRHGDVSLGESRAICSYVDRCFDGPTLLSEDPVRAAQTEQWASILQTTIEPLLVRQYLFAYMFPKTDDGQPDRALIDQLVPKLEEHFDLLEKAISNGEIGSDAFTLTDAYLIPILFYLQNAPESAKALEQRPLLTEYLARQLKRPSVQETMPPPLPGQAA